MSPVKLAAEFVGTFALIFMGAGAVALNQFIPNSVGLVGIALAHGLTIAVLVSALAHISGGKFNPAISLGLVAGGKLSLLNALWEIAAQLAGAAAGALTLWSILPEAASTGSHLGTPSLNPDFSFWAGVVAEAIASFFLVLTVYGTAIDPRGTWRSVAGFGIGCSIVFGILAIGGITGAALNPARAFGPALVSGHWANQAIYWIGPLLGGILAGIFYGRWLEKIRV